MTEEFIEQSVETGDGEADQPTGRRHLLTKASAAAAVAAVAGLAASDPARAANGGTMFIGENNVGTNTTRLSGGGSFRVVDGVSTLGEKSSIRGMASSNDHAGVRGEASGSAGYGIYGVSTGDNGRGVFGDNSGSGGNGVYGRHTGNGTDSAGVFGVNSGSGHGVRGRTTDNTSAGVYGSHSGTNGLGVYGHHDSTTQPGIGVLGRAEAGQGVVGRGGTLDVVADLSGRITLAKAGQEADATSAGQVGTLARDAAGHLWYCYADNLWERLSGSGFRPISPIRAYDSRIASIPESGTFAAGSNKVISIKDGRVQETGVINAADAVPAGATAIAYNVTATRTTAASFLRVAPGDVTSVAVSSLNWTGGGQTIANAGIVGVDASRQIRIIAGPGGTFDAIIDVTGYWS